MNLATLIPVLLKVSIWLIVFSFGLGLNWHDLSGLLKNPSLLLRSLFAMILVMPLFSLLMVKTFDLNPPVGVALLALALSPIPPMIPGKGLKAGGNSSYAFSLLFVAGLLSILFVPIGVKIYGLIFNRPIAIPAAAIAKIMLMAVLAPLTAGILFCRIFPALAKKIEKPISWLAGIMLLICIIPLLINGLPAIISLIGNGTVAALAAFIIVGLIIGHAFGGPRKENRIVLALSTASRHPGVAIAISSTTVTDQQLIFAAVLLFLLLNLVITQIYLYWVNKG